ncbi:hypothetical protein IWQ60_005158 [Tieghemiomyces parasiticus]|uniref:Complex 1 LYR protein domain-containing protein n=1 Tax=Tieghemiomyces parasiticus TaxID=78921 RepID=A0A9W8DUV3_9FUNG|nr:hypothetical protein IWQ60_005158 [Tieghemiomyces parasiticus]
MLSRPGEFFRHTAKHRLNVLGLYRSLLRLAYRLPDNVQVTYVRNWTRERFRFNRHTQGHRLLARCQAEADQARERLTRAVQGDPAERRLISDLAYGRFGRVFDTIQRIKAHHDPRKWCRNLDLRSGRSRKRDPHPAYRIPMDVRVFTPPACATGTDLLAFDPPRVPAHPVIYDCITNSGFTFKRIQGMRQPRRLSVRINRHNLRLQALVDARKTFTDLLDYAQDEDAWLASVGQAGGYETTNAELLALINESFNKLNTQSVATSSDYIIYRDQLYGGILD